MSRSYRLTVVLSILISVFAIDQVTKNWAVETLRARAPHVYLNGFFQFVYAENPGAFLGLGDSWSREIRFIVFALVVLIGLGGMLWYLFTREKSRTNLFAYSLILAGGFGNLWDRVANDHGHVIDFMLIDIWGPLRTGVFNVADMAIVGGVLLALYTEVSAKKKLSNPPAV